MPFAITSQKSFLSSAQDLPQTMKKKLQDRIDEADKQLNAHVQAIQKAIDMCLWQ